MVGAIILAVVAVFSGVVFLSGVIVFVVFKRTAHADAALGIGGVVLSPFSSSSFVT